MSTTNFSNEPDLASAEPDGDGPSIDDSGAKERAQQAAGTAKDEGQRVAGIAQDEARSLAREASNQARGLLDEATSQVEAQSKDQKDRLAEVVRTFGDDLNSMTAHEEGTSRLAGQLVQQAAEQARTIASHLEDREPRELLEDVRGFARRRPGTFLLGALVAGVVVGRVTRGAKDAKDIAPEPEPPTSSTAASQPQTPGSPASTASTDLGPKGVEMSETGIVGPDGGRA